MKNMSYFTSNEKRLFFNIMEYDLDINQALV